MPMFVVAVVGVLLPSAVIVTIPAWGWRHGTLIETGQERDDWEFEKIIRRF